MNKKCSKCKISKPVSEYFWKVKNKTLQLACKSCSRERGRNHQQTGTWGSKNRKKSRINKSKLNYNMCKCGAKKIDKSKHCKKCHYHTREKINWPKDLPNMVEQSSKRAVAKMLGVSDKAVAKRLKNHYNLDAVTE